jgi:hypothetical protein
MDLLQQAPLTALFSTPVQAFTGGATTLGSTNRFDYCISGFNYTKAAFNASATPTTDVNTGVAFLPVAKGFGCLFSAMLDASGNLKVAQGQIQAVDAAGYLIADPQMPAIPAGYCPISLIGVINAITTASWVFGTNNWTGISGTTCAIADIGTYPSRPPTFFSTTMTNLGT